MGFIAKVLDPESLEYDPQLSEALSKGLTPDSTIQELFDRINQAKEVYAQGGGDADHKEESDG